MTTEHWEYCQLIYYGKEERGGKWYYDLTVWYMGAGRSAKKLLSTTDKYTDNEVFLQFDAQSARLEE